MSQSVHRCHQGGGNFARVQVPILGGSYKHRTSISICSEWTLPPSTFETNHHRNEGDNRAHLCFSMNTNTISVSRDSRKHWFCSIWSNLDGALTCLQFDVRLPLLSPSGENKGDHTNSSQANIAQQFPCRH